MPCSAAWLLVSASKPVIATSKGLMCKAKRQSVLTWLCPGRMCQHMYWEHCDLPRAAPSTPWWYR